MKFMSTISPERAWARSRRAGSVARGFALVAAIFLMVILSSLATVLMNLFSTQQQTLATDLLGSRAYQAARAGIEWAAFGITATAQGSLWTGCAGGTTIPINQMTGTLSVFSVTVTCTYTTTTQGTTNIYVYNLSSTSTGPSGASLGSLDYVRRTITAQMTD